MIPATGPLTRVYAKAKADILDRIDKQEVLVAANRMVLPFDFPLPAKLLAVRRSKENMLREISPLTPKTQLSQFGKKTQPKASK